MRELSLEITLACNLNCRHCMRDFSNDRSDIPTDLIPRILDEARLLGAQEVVLTGGEPLLHHDLESLIRLISEKSYRFRVVTNGFSRYLFPGNHFYAHHPESVVDERNYLRLAAPSAIEIGDLVADDGCQPSPKERISPVVLNPA